MDITEVILNDHHEQRRMFGMLEEIDPADTEALNSVWTRLRILLEVHAAAEEKLFYPRLVKLQKDLIEQESPGEETEDAIHDHNEIRDAIAGVTGQDVGSTEWQRAVAHVNEVNSDHMAEEERQVSPTSVATSAWRSDRPWLSRSWRSSRSTRAASPRTTRIRSSTSASTAEGSRAPGRAVHTARTISRHVMAAAADHAWGRQAAGYEDGTAVAPRNHRCAAPASDSRTPLPRAAARRRRRALPRAGRRAASRAPRSRCRAATPTRRGS